MTKSHSVPTPCPYLTMCIDIHDIEDAIRVMNKEIEEVNAILEQLHQEPGCFQPVKTVNNVVIQSSRIHGSNPSFYKRASHLFHATIHMPMNAEECYDFLASHDGAMFLDPNRDLHNHSKVVAGPFEWPDHLDSILQIEYERMNMPILSARDYVVLNGYDRKSLSLYSFSVNAPALVSIPGHCNYGVSSSPGPHGCIRVPTFSAFRLQPVDEHQCNMQSLMWMDLMGWIPATINNQASAGYLEDLIRRSMQLNAKMTM
jgi:hypothetical protein